MDSLTPRSFWKIPVYAPGIYYSVLSVSYAVDVSYIFRSIGKRKKQRWLNGDEFDVITFCLEWTGQREMHIRIVDLLL